MGKEEKVLLSLGRESLVYRVGEDVIKCYAPENDRNFRERYLKLFQESDTFHLRKYDRDLRKEFFNKEAALLKALSESSQRMVPQTRKINPENLSITMEFIDHPDFQQAIISNPSNVVGYTQRMVGTLARFHEHCNSLMGNLPKDKLRGLGMSEEAARWVNYLRTIIFYESGDFEEFCRTKGINLPDYTTRQVRGHIDTFLAERGIDLRQRVTDFIARDRTLTDYEATFVWAEAKPQNIMFTPPTEDRKVVIDLPRARRGAGSDIDLFTIINHAHRQPFSPEREQESIQLANEYFQRVGTPIEDIPARHARLLATGMKEAVRLLANYCQKNPYEIYTILGRQDEYPGDNGEKEKEGFLEEKIDSLRKFFDYYRYRSGEGWELVVEGPLADKPEYRGLVRQQIETIEEILKDSGVLRGVILSQRRAKKFRTILAPRY